MSNDLNFGKVDMSYWDKQLVNIAAVIQAHNNLPKDKNGIATVTLRSLVKTYAPGVTGLLREYVCTFGSHGTNVVKKFVDRQYRGPAGGEAAWSENFDKEVAARVKEIEADLNK